MKGITLFLILFILVIDLYSFKGLFRTFPGSFINQWIFIVFYFSVTAIFLLSVVFIARFNFQERKPEIFAGFYLFAGIFMLIYLPKLVFIVFHLAEDLYHMLAGAAVYIARLFGAEVQMHARNHFISFAGLAIAVIPLLAFLYGMTFGRFNYEIEKVRLVFPELPAAFEGLRIIHISDLHLGSIYNQKERLEKAIGLINDQKPDLILFTGDLVNNFSEEALGWEEILGQLKAKHGKYSILGNHDYGDYWEWAIAGEKKANLTLLYDIQKKMGFRLLLNESVHLSQGNDTIALVGVENWGRPPFKQYGDLNRALASVNGTPFKILLSHDPTHWDAEVVQRTAIPLTLSGHTHAMQIGIKINGFSWSPSKYIYEHWNGLYREGDQYLYVNRGLGFIGFPGRVGMRPEITLIELGCSR
jgi:hypothetical protein